MTTTKGDNVKLEHKDDKSRLDQPPFLKQKDFKKDYSGHCFCGAIQFEVSGKPKENPICHCKSCQRLHSAPASLNSIFEFSQVQIVKGAEEDLICYSPQNRQVGFYKDNLPVKLSCKHCFSAIGNHGRSMMLIHPTLLEFDEAWPAAYKPSFHQYYADRIQDISDDLPKYNKKKHDEPLNTAAEEKIEKDEAKKKEKDGKRQQEEQEDNEAHAAAAKRQKKEN